MRVLIPPTASSLLSFCRNQRTQQRVAVKATADFPFRNERDILKRFNTVSSLRRLIDEVKDPPLLVLEHLDSDLLTESATQKLQSSETKRVARAVLQALAALHDEGIVHTGACKISTLELCQIPTH